MMKRIFLLIVLLFIIIFMPLQMINPKNIKDKDIDKKVDKDDKIKENNGKKIGQIDKAEKIKGDLIYSEILEKETGVNKNLKIDISDNGIENNRFMERKDKINRCLTSLEGLQVRIDNMKKETKIISSDNLGGMKKEYLVFDEIKKSFESESVMLLKSLDKDEKELVKAQSEKINASNKNLNKLLSDLNDEMAKKKPDNKDLFENTKKIEEEVKVIYRQLRAIEWIISN